MHRILTIPTVDSRWSRAAGRTVLLVCALGALMLGLPMPGMAQEGDGVIRGRVLDTSGQPVFGATIQTARIPGFADDAPLTVARAETGGDGSYELGKLGRGLYRLCVQHQSETILDPCAWAEEQVTVQLSDGGVLEGINVTVEHASMLRIAIADPEGTLTAEEEGSRRKLSFVYVAVRTSVGGMRKAKLLRTTEDGYELGVAVPKDQDADVFIAGHNLEMKDRNNQDLKELGQVVRVSKEALNDAAGIPVRLDLARKETAAP